MVPRNSSIVYVYTWMKFRCRPIYLGHGIFSSDLSATFATFSLEASFWVRCRARQRRKEPPKNLHLHPLLYRSICLDRQRVYVARKD